MKYKRNYFYILINSRATLRVARLLCIHTLQKRSQMRIFRDHVSVSVRTWNLRSRLFIRCRRVQQQPMRAWKMRQHLWLVRVSIRIKTKRNKPPCHCHLVYPIHCQLSCSYNLWFLFTLVSICLGVQMKSCRGKLFFM